MFSVPEQGVRENEGGAIAGDDFGDVLYDAGTGTNPRADRRCV